MPRILLLFLGLLLGISVYSQEHDAVIYKEYQKDKARFQSFESQHRKFIQTKNHKISYLKWGDQEGKIFVWLPGSLLSAYDFYPFSEDLVKEGYKVLSVDHYGHGLTDIPAKDLDFWDFADDLALLLEQENATKAVIAGFSRGAYLATAFYQQYPEKIEAIILEEGGSVSFKRIFNEMGTDKLEEFLLSVEVSEDLRKLLFEAYSSDFEIYKNIKSIEDSDLIWQSFGFMKQQGKQWIFYKGLNEYMNMQDSLHYSQVLNSPESISKYARSMVNVDPLSIYAELHVPLLIIEAKGEDDLFDMSKGNNDLKNLHPNLIQLNVFDCDSHNLHYACPDQFKKILQSFLKEL